MVFQSAAAAAASPVMNAERSMRCCTFARKASQLTVSADSKAGLFPLSFFLRKLFYEFPPVLKSFDKKDKKPPEAKYFYLFLMVYPGGAEEPPWWVFYSVALLDPLRSVQFSSVFPCKPFYTIRFLDASPFQEKFPDKR